MGLGGALQRRFTDGSLRAEAIEEGVTRIRLESRATRHLGLCVTPYLVGGLLIDTGFAHVRGLVIRFLADRPLDAICCTHHHEDHTANAGTLATAHGCPVYLANLDARSSEGIDPLPLYRRFYWGHPVPYTPLEMPAQIESGNRVLRAIPTPGHSVTHVSFFEERTGLVFTGDLFVSPGASAVMRYEDPFELIRSLRRVAELEPSRMLGGHGLLLQQPARALQRKADRIEEAADKVLRLHEQGVPARQIAQRLFTSGHTRDRIHRLITAGEYSRVEFVRRCVAKSSGRGAAMSEPD